MCSCGLHQRWISRQPAKDVVEVAVGDVPHALLVEPVGQLRPGEHDVGQQRCAAVADAVAHVHKAIAVKALVDGMALALAPAEMAGVAAVLAPHECAAVVREHRVVGHNLEVTHTKAIEHFVDDAAEPGAHDDQTVVVILGEPHQLGEPLAGAGMRQHQVDDLVVWRGDRGELLLHGLLHRDLPGTERRFEFIPHAGVPVGIHDHMEGVTHGDGAVEVHGDEELCHDERGYQRRTIPRVSDEPEEIEIEAPRPVFIHGAGRTPASWGPQLARFEGALAVALPGHPDGQPLQGTVEMAQWVIAEVEEIPGPLVMVGHSLGGAVALEVALLRPDLVAGLILVSTGARLPVPDDAIARIDDDFAAECTRMVEQSWLHHEPELIRRGIASVVSMGPEALMCDYLSARDHDVRNLLSDITAPALVIAGEADPLVPPWISEELADGLPDAEMAVVPEAAHVPQLERADVVDLLVAAWLARLELSMPEDDD